MDPFVQSILLVLLGAAITLAGTLLSDHLRGRRELNLDRERRDAQREQQRRDDAKAEARSIHDSLLTLAEAGGAQSRSGQPIQEDPVLVADIRHRYLLIPDVPVRDALAKTLELIANRRTRAVSDADFVNVSAAAAFVVAAYIRGEPLPQDWIDSIAKTRAKYKVS